MWWNNASYKVIIMINCNQKRAGPRNPQPYALLPLRPWVLAPLLSDSHPCTLIPPYLRTSYLHDLRSSSIRATTDSATQDSTQDTTLIMPFRWMYSRKTLRFSLSDYVHSPRAQALPLNLMFLTTRRPDHSSKLSLSNSCSNELDQTSDAAENPRHSRSSELQSSSLL
jgi:hypothetical protein